MMRRLPKQQLPAVAASARLRASRPVKHPVRWEIRFARNSSIFRMGQFEESLAICAGGFFKASDKGSSVLHPQSAGRISKR